MRKRDVLRMDGLLPPTRRLPVCDAVSSTSDKKKDRKWSIGGILRRISSIRDYDSSSNDEEIVYKKLPRKSIKFVKQSDDVVLHSLENNLEHDKRVRVENNVRHSADSPHSYRDSLHSRSSDGSLDGLGKKSRRNKLKARAEAKRDHLCVDSSSDEDCRRSNGSLNRFNGAETGQRSNNACNNRKTRAARTERYIKRLSRDDVNGSGDTLNDLQHKNCPTESYIEDKERVADNGGMCRPPVHPRRFAGSSNDRTFFSTQISSVENLRDVNRTGLPSPETIHGDYRRYSTGIQYVTDLNQNNTYGKISRSPSKTACADNYRVGNFFTYPAKHSWHHLEPCADYITDRRPIDATNNRPPEPPPRDPRYRVFNYGYSSYPARKQQYNAPNSCNKQNDEIGMSILDDMSSRSNYGSHNKIVWRNGAERRANSTSKTTDFRNSLERINNQYNSTRHGANNAEEIENAARCRRRNTRNNQLNCGNDGNYSAYKSTNICKPNKQCEMTILSRADSSDWSSRRSPCEQRVSRSVTPTSTCVDNRNERSKREDARRATPSEEVLERRRSSRNLEEALSELEAIYNSLRLGDEDLLDRAERRSMEEFSLKQSKNELDAATIVPDDSPDRTTDDMAYRRMHPKERPTSLSDIAGQSALSNISYLIASPILSRRDSADDLTRLCSSSATYPSYRRNEPDVTRDDVVFRSITHANNTLRVIDPQPPFGIPLGPVTAATESDYLHTTPTKPEQPRSPYIPQCEPDVVTDDLAYRTLRKDAGAARSPTENRIVAKEQPADVTRKKRAVRSLSANLYGLINHDRIHLRREPSLDAIRDEIQNAGTSFAAATSCERPEYLRRVVSDGELSDTDARRRNKPGLDGRDTDINGNHPAMGACRDNPCVYTLLETTKEATRSPKKASSAAELSDAAMVSSKTVLDDDFWHEYLRSDSNISAANSGTTETDFSAYSRLCQDLVNLIKSDEDTTPPIESPNADDSAFAPADKSNDVERGAVDEPATSARSLDSHCTESQRAARASDERRVLADENAGSPFPSSIANSAEPSTSEPNQPAGNFDFYLRVADKNVKLIAEAFGDVADRLRDSRLSVPRNNSSSHGSEAESYSTRSSTLYSQDEQTARNDERRLVSPRQFAETAREKRNSTTSNEGDQSSGNRYEDVSTADAELDLSRAVRNLQLAAASLCEHGPEIESLRIRRAGRIDVTPVTSTDENEDSNPMRKVGLIADALRQEQERDQKEEKTAVLPSGVETTTRSDATRCEENREGERHAEVCELDRTESQLECGVRAPYVTNIITVTITTYSILLLACLLALLVAIVVAL